MRKNQAEVMEWKNSMNEMKNATESIYGRAEQAGRRVNGLRG